MVKPVNKMVLVSKLKAMQRIAHMRHKLKEASEQLEQANERLSQQVNEDGLTKLANRRYLDQKLTEFISWHGRNNFSLTIIMVDVDHFKPFNDHYGHLEGDRCLQAVAGELKQTFSRAGELAARYGGEEFVILLSHCDKTKAVKECERLKNCIQKLEIPHSKSTTSDFVTVSQGWYLGSRPALKLPKICMKLSIRCYIKPKSKGETVLSLRNLPD